MAFAALSKRVHAAFQAPHFFWRLVQVHATDAPHFFFKTRSYQKTSTQCAYRSSDMSYKVKPIAFVSAARQTPVDDCWGGEISKITLVDKIDPSALSGVGNFSHVEVLYLFHGVSEDEVVFSARHPRNNLRWPKIGIFAQRGKNRPNRIGTTICKIAGIYGRVLKVCELDAIDGTPVLDIKPVMKEFLPREPTHQPSWATDLMAKYWDTRSLASPPRDDPV
jgi:tRNA-Thr(GGU) m(6)t(6)A37 methyltransferase TsaA